jgi:hypothetical protein
MVMLCEPTREKRQTDIGPASHSLVWHWENLRRDWSEKNLNIYRYDMMNEYYKFTIGVNSL